MKILLNTDDSNWGQDGAWFASRPHAIQCMRGMASDYGLGSDSEIEAHVDSTLREIDIATATNDELDDIERTMSMLPGGPAEAEVLAAIAARRAQIETGVWR